jgi:hypothetical protein
VPPYAAAAGTMQEDASVISVWSFVLSATVHFLFIDFLPLSFLRTIIFVPLV